MLSLGAAVIAVVVALAVAGYWTEVPLLSVLVLGAVAAAAERRSVRIGCHVETSVAAIPMLFTAVIYGPAAAMLVGAFALVGEVGAPHVRWILWMFQRMLVGALIGFIAAAVLVDDASVVRMFIAVAAAASAEVMVDTALTSLTVALRHPGRFGETVRTLSRVAVSTVPLYAPLITILAYAYVVLSPWALLLFLAPALAAQHLLMLYQGQRQLAHELREANEELAASSVSFSGALVTALDERDTYTAGHSAAVAVYARAIAAQLGLSREDQDLAYVAGLLHDIGKVGLPAGLLEKEGPLTAEERRIMETHPSVGERILGNIRGYGDVAKIVRFHHERIDGAGYPDGLRGEAIPLLSRIIGVADAYDAMTSGRPYRAALDVTEARSRLQDAVGTQFDHAVVEAFGHVLGETADSAQAARQRVRRRLTAVAVPKPRIASVA